jgi:hypothetical protein
MSGSRVYVKLDERNLAVRSITQAMSVSLLDFQLMGNSCTFTDILLIAVYVIQI